MEAATGERIVAFGRVGKRSKTGFGMPFRGLPFVPGIGANGVERNLKPRGVRLWPEELPTWL